MFKRGVTACMLPASITGTELFTSAPWVHFNAMPTSTLDRHMPYTFTPSHHCHRCCAHPVSIGSMPIRKVVLTARAIACCCAS